jgi:hypothetical protein
LAALCRGYQAPYGRLVDGARAQVGIQLRAFLVLDKDKELAAGGIDIRYIEDQHVILNAQVLYRGGIVGACPGFRRLRTGRRKKEQKTASKKVLDKTGHG